MNAYIQKPFGWSPGKKRITWQKMIIGGVVVMVLAGFFMALQAPIKNTFYYATSPFLQFFWNTGSATSDFFGSFFQGQSIARENSNLKQENEKLLSALASWRQTLQDYQQTKEAMEVTGKDAFALVPAGIVGQDIGSDLILINKGSADGVLENMPVISSTKVLYGKVVKVYRHFSQVMLISSNQSVADVKIQEASMANEPVLGVVKGSGSFALELDLVPSEANISPNDVVTTSALEGIFPKDLLIGKIISVNKHDAKPFQTAAVDPFFDITKMDTLFVITNYLRK